MLLLIYGKVGFAMKFFVVICNFNLASLIYILENIQNQSILDKICRPDNERGHRMRKAERLMQVLVKFGWKFLKTQNTYRLKKVR